jgi:SAM-dependent methyltransferase
VAWQGDEYQDRFDRLAATGADVHGEASFVADLTPATVLDAGCGTGRVTLELGRRGIDVVGVDADGSMLATARRLGPDRTWVEADLTDPGFDLGRRFDVVVMAGNVPRFVRPGTQGALVATCARHLAPSGRLVAGFQLDREYGLGAYDEQCAAVGLVLDARFATWSRDPFVEGGDYAVSIHRPS